MILWKYWWKTQSCLEAYLLLEADLEKFEIKVENSPLANSEKVGFLLRLCFPPIFPSNHINII